MGECEDPVVTIGEMEVDSGPVEVYVLVEFVINVNIRMMCRSSVEH